MRWIEEKAATYSSVKGIEIAFVLIVMLIFSRIIGASEDPALGPVAANTFFHSAIWGLLTFLLVEVVGGILDRSQEMLEGAAKGGFGAFLYLEVLDASFSFDGVIGAFALTQNLFIIAIGLGIGAMYVRSMTIMLVEKERWRNTVISSTARFMRSSSSRSSCMSRRCSIFRKSSRVSAVLP